jgi:hypothetical protein
MTAPIPVVHNPPPNTIKSILTTISPISIEAISSSSPVDLHPIPMPDAGKPFAVPQQIFFKSSSVSLRAVLILRIRAFFTVESY